MGCEFEGIATGVGGRALIACTAPRAACWSLRAGEARVQAIPPVPHDPGVSRQEICWPPAPRAGRGRGGSSGL